MHDLVLLVGGVILGLLGSIVSDYFNPKLIRAITSWFTRRRERTNLDKATDINYRMHISENITDVEYYTLRVYMEVMASVVSLLISIFVLLAIVGMVVLYVAGARFTFIDQIVPMATNYIICVCLLICFLLFTIASRRFIKSFGSFRSISDPQQIAAELKELQSSGKGIGRAD